MLRRTPMSIFAVVISAAIGCDQLPSTAPRSPVTPPSTARADKQGTTSSEMLLEYNLPGGDVYRMGDDGTNLVQLTSNAGSEFDPAWAPDGKRVLYGARSLENDAFAIFVMNSDGTGVTQLTHPASNGDGEPNALGKGIVFTRSTGVGQGAIYRMNADGTGITQLTFGLHDNHPAPSPKATSVAFVRDDDIYVLDLVSGGLTNITNTPTCAESNPAYSPSGKQIAFDRGYCNGAAGIFVMNDDGTQMTRLTGNGSINGTDPAWSPDGKRIGFTELGVPTTTIYVMNADGSAMTPLLSIPDRIVLLAAWSRY
jgi:Tol biopolymer transport system component